MKFSHAAVLEIKSVRSTLVAFSTMYSYGEKKFANVKGYFTDYYHAWILWFRLFTEINETSNVFGK